MAMYKYLTYYLKLINRIIRKIYPVSLIPSGKFNHDDVPFDEDICHDNWGEYLREHFDKKGFDILDSVDKIHI